MRNTRIPPLARLETTIEAAPAALYGIHRAMEDFWRAVDRLAQTVPHLPDARWRMQFDMAVWEVGTNIVRHGHPPEAAISGLVELQISMHDNRAEAHFTDHGLPWEEPTADIARAWCADSTLALPESGLGLHIVRCTLDTFSYNRTDDGTNHWNLIKLLHVGPREIDDI